MAELFFLCLPYGEPMRLVPALLKAGKRVVDLSGDFRLKNPGLYPKWYGFRHTVPKLLKQAVYGMPELHGREVRNARLLSNPGCYPTGTVLAAAPLVAEGWVKPGSLIVDARSGISGAGRKATLQVHFAEINENMKPYKVGGVHQHIPEMEQELSRAGGVKVTLCFTPYYAPLTRGIHTTLYADLKRPAKAEAILDDYRLYYAGAPFVRIYPAGKLPDVRSVAGTNYCDIGLTVDPRTRRVIVVSAIDNLVKGAAGQAVHNMNLMMGFPETEALLVTGLVP
jgi:N-acetyl-gamma-glutamyl-phosphate reductase